MWNQALILNTVRGNIEILRKLSEGKSESGVDLLPYNRSDFNNPDIIEIIHKAAAFEDERFRQSLLHIAIATKNIETVKLLIELGCNVNSYNRRNESVLYFAVINECNEIVELLVEKNANVNDRRCNESVLNCAARIRNESLTRFLLNHGADVNYENDSGTSPLHHGAKFYNPIVASIMLVKGAYVNKRDMYGLTPLHVAVNEGNVSVVELLLENGADISSEASNGNTPLIMATCKPIHNSYEIIKLLLEKGAKCNSNRFHKTPALCRALTNCDCRTVKLLLDNGADIRVDNWKKFSALHYAAMNPRADVIEYILDYGIDVNTRSRYSNTPLHIAVRQGYDEGCKLLLSRGAKVNRVDYGGNSPLYLAVKIKKSSTLVKLLLEYGAEVCSKSPSDNAIMNVAKNRDITVRNILIEHVAKLVSLNTWVSEIELEAIGKDFEMISYYKKCIKELEKMKIRKVYENVCLFNILMERGMASGYARNEDLIEALDSAENQLKYEFPIYYSLLKEDFYKEIKKQRLIKRAAIVLSEIFNFYDPFHFANLTILSYLSEEDIIRINETA